jgi:hypothetical protein
MILPQRHADAPLLVRTNDASKAHRALSTKFLRAVNDAWDRHGDAVLDRLALEYPQVFAPMVARLVQVQKVEVGGPDDFHVAMTRAELLDRVGERFGQAGRNMFEKFVRSLERLEVEARERKEDDHLSRTSGTHAQRP